MEVLPDLVRDFEIVVVDDGSIDGTAGILDEIKEKVGDTLKIVLHGDNRGYGEALKSGFAAAAKDLQCFMDSDGQFDVAEIENLLIFADKYDIVSGQRIVRQDNFGRVLFGMIFSMAIRFFFKVNLLDLNCGFKMFKKGVVRPDELVTSGAMINAEMLVRAHKRGASLMIVGVHHFPRKVGAATGFKPAVVWKAIKEFVGLLRELK